MDLQELKRRIVEKEEFDYLFFWKHTSKNDYIGPTCMSQWFEANFEIDGQTYPTAEHFMMAEKARLFGDQDILSEILETSHPHAAQKLGRKVKGFNDGHWKTHRFDIIVRGNVAKFGQNNELGEYLYHTGDSILVEASPRDRIWGIGLGKEDTRATDPFKWRGINLLGFALMEVREQMEER